MEEEDHWIETFRSRKRGPSRSVCCIVATVLGVLLVVSLAAVVGLSVGVALVSNKQDSSSCLTPECVELGAQVLASLDETFDPCFDFYKFACNKALEQAIIPYDAFETGGFDKLEEAKIEKFRVQLSKPVNDTTVEAVGKAATYYQSCVNASTLTDSQVRDFLHQLLTELGGWPLVGIGESNQTYDINAEEGYLTEILYGSSAFFTLSVEESDDPDVFTSTLSVREGGYIANKSLELFRSINPDISDSVYQAAIGEISNFEMAIENLTDHDYYPEDVGTLTTLIELMPEFHWIQNLQYYGRIGDFSVKVNVSTPVKIYASPSYLRGVNTLIANTDATTLQNYAKLHLVSLLQPILTQDYIASYNFITNLKADSSIPSLRQGVQRDPPPYVACVGMIEYIMPFAMARVFTEAYSPDGVAESILTIVTGIRAALKERISEKEWLDDTTKQRALNKVDKIIDFLVYPEFIYDNNKLNKIYASLEVSATVGYSANSVNLVKFITLTTIGRLGSTSRNDWDRSVSPTTVNAFYSPYGNQIYILEGILDTPFFKTYWPDYFKFSTIGLIIGHELVHGFDNTGREYDENGKFVNWWSEQAVEEFNTRAQCFVNQYNQYSLPAGQVNGNLTLGENIADNGGLATAYQAYKDLGETEKMLPGLKYTPDQLFFIGSTQPWCSIITKEGQEIILGDVHTPSSLRPLGFLSNSPEFAAAFNCSSGSRMNPTHKCEIW